MHTRKNRISIYYTILLLLLAGYMLAGCDPDDPTDQVQRTRTSPALSSFNSCRELEAALKSNLKEELRVQLLSLNDITILYGFPEDDSATDADTNGGREEGEDYSGTNNQEEGVDEADFVKTDGYHIYTLNGNKLVIAGVPEFGQLTQEAIFEIEGYPTEMLISKDNDTGQATRAVVFSNLSTYSIQKDNPLYEYYYDNSSGETMYPVSTLLKLTIIDLKNPLSPEVIQELYLEGYYQTARNRSSSINLIAYSSMYIQELKYWPDVPDEYYEMTEDDPRRKQIWDEAIQRAIAHNDAYIDTLALADLVPRIFEKEDGDIIDHSFTAEGCANFTTADDGMSRGFTSIISFNLQDTEFTFDADHIVSNWSMIYASSDTLLIAEPAQNSWWYWGVDDTFDEATNIHRFDISDFGKAVYTSSGRIDGTVLNQFSLSEYNDYIRVASTTGQWNRWWMEEPDPPENHVYVLKEDDNKTLEVVGSVKGIAQGERIWSARFIRDTAYLVTFKNIDPLWVIDLSSPENPTILGELEVPGVSTYIHPIDNDTLLTIGYGGDEEGLDWSIKVSLFDVSDYSDPSLIDELPLVQVEDDNQSSYSTWSEAAGEHKAFQYWAPKKMLAVPLSSYRYTYSGQEEPPSADLDNSTDADVVIDYEYEYSSRLMLVNVDPETGLLIHGSVDHSDFYNADPGYYWYSQEIRRSIFMGDYIYAISDRAITASDIDDLSLSATLELPGSQAMDRDTEVVEN